MHHARRIRMLVILLAGAGALLVSGAGPVETADNPIVDRSASSCATTLTATQIEILPTAGRDFTGVAGLSPGTFTPLNVSFRFNRRGAPTHVLVDGEALDFEARVRRFNPDTCEIITQPTKTIFGRDPVGGVVNFVYKTEPQPWAQISFTNLRRGAERFPNIRLDYQRAGGPVVPIPQDPGTPGVPVPGDDAGGFRGLQPLGGPIIRTGGRFNGFFQARDHGDCANHTINGVRLCVIGTGPSTSEVLNATDDGFVVRRLGPPKTGLFWGDAKCGMDGCELSGSFYKQPLRATLSAVRAPSVAELFADSSVYLNEGRPNSSVIQFDYRATYVHPGSTQTTSPFPSVPSVPVVPPQPTGYPIADGPLITDGIKFDVTSVALLHSQEECRRHTLTVGGATYQVCLVGQGNSVWESYNARSDGFRVRGLSTTRTDVRWQDGDCGANGCRFQGTFLGLPAEKTLFNPRGAWNGPAVQTEEEVTVNPGQPNQSKTRFRVDIRGMF